MCSLIKKKFMFSPNYFLKKITSVEKCLHTWWAKSLASTSDFEGFPLIPLLYEKLHTAVINSSW